MYKKKVVFNYSAVNDKSVEAKNKLSSLNSVSVAQNCYTSYY